MDPRLAGAARAAVKAGSAVADLALRPPTGIVILIYHRVGSGTGGQMDVSTARFDDQLAWLSATQRVLRLDEALTELAGPGPVEPGVVLTFDDGTDDWAPTVAPLLARHRVPATFYVATSFVEDGIELPGAGRPATWSQLAELRDCGWATIGAHTHRHLLLDRLAPDEIEAELARADDLLGDRLGIAAEHFCYPKAVPPSAAADAAVRRRYRSAVLAGTRANRAGADAWTLARSPVQASDGTRWFRAKVRGGLGAEDRLRERLNRRRYRSATS